MKVWKIRDSSCGLFWAGRYSSKFVKGGRLWARRGHLLQSLRAVEKYTGFVPPSWEIVEFDVVENANATVNAAEEHAVFDSRKRLGGK
jgi:hypothetical protein